MLSGSDFRSDISCSSVNTQPKLKDGRREISLVKLVYTHPNIIVVGQARSSIELAGIECIVRNEYAAGAIGELAPIDAWPELWVMNDRDFERARLLLEKSHIAIQEPDWQCERCGSFSPGTFEFCWHCAGER